jgi:UbiD family decarboxylase
MRSWLKSKGVEKPMSKDFRDYLEYLGKKEKLLRVEREVDTRFEIAAGIRETSDNDGPALLYQNIKGFPGWRVAAGVYATQKLIALALGLPQEADEDALVRRYLECDEKCLEPKLVATGPVKEVIIRGEDVDLTKLPIPTYSALDAGPYLSAGVEFARDPETGIQNVSIHRRMVLGKDKTAILAQGYQHLGRMIQAAEQRGQGLGIATVLGADPSLVLASQVKAPEGVDEAGIAGAFRGAPLEMVRCETIDVEVPANAEVVIEGQIVPGERVMDGPFGEFPGNYITLMGTPNTECYVIKVTAITMRKNPIFQAMLTGMPMTENHMLKKWCLAATAFREVSRVADVKSVNITRGGAGYHFVVSIRKKAEQEPRNLIYTLHSARLNSKLVTVVDDDIDVYDPEAVEWALATRMWAHRDIIIIPPLRRGPDDLPVPGMRGRIAQWGIDATAPLEDRQWYRKALPG